MTSNASNDLRTLRDRPFELLRELERRSKVALAGPAAGDQDAKEWVGIGFRLGTDWFLVGRYEVREIMMVPPNPTRVPGAKPWVLGLANVRGQLIPLIDIKQFLGAGSSASDRTGRVLVLNSREYPLGIVVDEVIGFRRFLETEFKPEFPETVVRCERYLDGAYFRGDDNWPIFNMTKLLEAREFQYAAAS